MPLFHRVSILACLVLLVVATAGAFLWLHERYGVGSAPLIGERRPALRFSDGEGRPVNFDHFLGTKLLVVFVDLECGFCKDQFDTLLELSKRSGPDTPAIVVVVRQDDVAAFGFPPEGELPFPIWADGAGQLRSKLGAAAVPAIFVLDAQGILRHAQIGYRGLHDVETILMSEEPIKQSLSTTTTTP